jgi:hypothetical protein
MIPRVLVFPAQSQWTLRVYLQDLELQQRPKTHPTSFPREKTLLLVVVAGGYCWWLLLVVWVLLGQEPKGNFRHHHTLSRP